MSSLFFQFIDDLQECRTRISGAWSMIFTFEIIIAPFYLTKSENRTKGSLTQFSYYCWVKSLFFSKNADFLFNIIPSNFRWLWFPPPTAKLTTQKPTQIRVKSFPAVLYISSYTYVLWNLITVGSLQFPNDSTITSVEANQNRPKSCLFL